MIRHFKTMRWPNPDSRQPDESLYLRISAKRLEARLSIHASHPNLVALSNRTTLLCGHWKSGTLRLQITPVTILSVKDKVHISNRSFI
jgi:hypothetical protein